MDQPEEELEQIATWFSEEGLSHDSPKEAQLRRLWSALQRTRSLLSSVTWDSDTQRSQHSAEMAEVRKSLEQIRIFTQHKDVLTREVQDENDQLKDQLRHVISLQDSQISEVAKMLYQQGLTELIHSSPSEQVAYLLVERASLLESSGDPNIMPGDGHAASLLGTEAKALNSNANQFPLKGVPGHGRSPWKRLFGLHKGSQSKLTFIPIEGRHSAGQASSVERECSRLERDVEEGSRRLAMAHTEIRHLTDELESAHLTQRAYEPELQAAQQEVDEIRQEVQKLKKYELVELRKAKALNDRLELEIRASRSRIRNLDAEKSSLQQMVGSLQKKVEQLKSALMEQPQLHTKQSQVAEAAQSNQSCRHLQGELTAHREHEETVHSLKQQLNPSLHDPDNLTASVFERENNVQNQKSCQEHGQPFENTPSQLKADEMQTQLQLQNFEQECPDYQKTLTTPLATKDECETLQREICETLKCLDKERRKCHEMKEKHKAKLCRTKRKCDEQTTWRDEKIKNLERQLSLCCHSLSKEKEITISITVENEKLLGERRRLLQQLNEEEHNKKDSNLSASLSKCRVDFLEMENKKLGNKIVHMSNQQAGLKRNMQKMQPLHFAEECKKTSKLRVQGFKSLAVQTSSVVMPEVSETQGSLD
ncbi:ccdc30 [Pungitius sinensis]